MFGEEALVASLTMCATAVAEGSVECVGVDRATFTEVRAKVNIPEVDMPTIGRTTHGRRHCTWYFVEDRG